MASTNIQYYLYYPDSDVPSGPVRFWAWSGMNPYPLSYDSRSPTGGASGSYTAHSFGQLGHFRLTFHTLAIATGCQFDTLSQVTERTINVVACKPRFLENSNGPTQRMPTGTI